MSQINKKCVCLHNSIKHKEGKDFMMYCEGRGKQCPCTEFRKL